MRTWIVGIALDFATRSALEQGARACTEVDALCVDDFAAGWRLLLQRTDVAAAGVPALIVVDADAAAPAVSLIAAVRGHASLRRVPIVALVGAMPAGGLAPLYEAGINSAVPRPEQSSSLTKTMEQLLRYWLTFNEPAPETGGHAVDG
ncbi:MAG: hypothetical protein AMXMBFR6_17510 [Betaproteobacteria bacterium]